MQCESFLYRFDAGQVNLSRRPYADPALLSMIPSASPIVFLSKLQVATKYQYFRLKPNSIYIFANLISD